MDGDHQTGKWGGRQPRGERLISRLDRRVLIVDDTRDSAETLAMLARHLGYRVQLCFSGLNCLECLDEFRPDVVLLDLGMPLMDGFDVCRAIRGRSEFQNVVVIACTSFDRHEECERALAAGFSHFLQKPVPLRVLDETLRRVAA